MSVLTVILISFSIFQCVHNSDPRSDLSESEQDIEDVPVFVATNEWQEIKPGQSIPQGLHIRVDFQTGIREAKLLEEDHLTNNDGTIQLSQHAIIDNDEENTDTIAKYGHSDRRGIINKSTKVFTRKELSEMLKNLKDKTPDGNIPLLSGDKGVSSSDGDQSPSPQKNTFMTMDELRGMVTFHSDIETMLKHLHILTNPDTPTEDIVLALNELEYHVHQIDNARDLDLLGGLVVIVKLLNHSDNSVKSAAAFTLGAAVQGNPEVQERALTYQALPQLLNLLVTSSTPELLQRRVLYALGSLIRGHPLAIESFVANGGLDKISYNIDEQSEAVLTKIITLLTDLLTFEDLHDKTSITKSGIISKLSDIGWCTYVQLSLQSSELKTLENTILLMAELTDHCDYISELTRLESIRDSMSDVGSDAIEPLNNIIQTLRTRNRKL